MKPALLLVDLQRDFLERPGLVPGPDALVAHGASLLERCRAIGIPIAHVRTVIHRRLDNRMPHWKRNGYWACVSGTPGCDPPAPLLPLGEERVFEKSFYSAFGNPLLERALREMGADTLILAGVYLHSCVRATALDGYELGYTVWVAEDAVGTTEPLHADMTRSYLHGRAAEFLRCEEILERLGRTRTSPAGMAEASHPVGYVAGRPIRAGRSHELWEHRNPARWDEVLGHVALATPRDAEAAVTAAARAFSRWRHSRHQERVDLLNAWSEGLIRRVDALAVCMATEIGKPVSEGRAEVEFAVELIRTTAQVFAEEPSWIACADGGVSARHCPQGVVALITPWNNPVSIPVGKLAAALVFGNAVVWKAACQAPRAAILLMESALEAGVPQEVVNLLFGDASTAQRVIMDSRIAAVAFTGSTRAGREVGALCGRYLKPLQAELGGNNAALLMPDCDVDRTAQELVDAAISFSGQRCTATRRIIAHEKLRKPITEALLSVMRSVRMGDPHHPATQVGPLISRPRQQEVAAMVRHGVHCGVRVLCGGGIPPSLAFGCWFEPTLALADHPSAPLVEQETFGPVVVLQFARDLDEALTLCNRVPQGLVASFYGEDPSDRRRFLEAVEAGVVKINQATLGVDPRAPFGGWKASGLGPPEHGMWDRDLFTRIQAVYGWPS